MTHASTAPDLVKVRDLPDSLYASVSARLSHHTIAFIRITPSHQGDDAQLLGTGVLVKAGPVHAVLTAQHVLAVLPTAGTLCVLLEPTPHPHMINVAGLTYRPIAKGKVDSEGPDLATIVLAPSIASSLAAKKSFYNLDLRREKALNAPDDIHDGVWALQGWVDERTEVSTDAASREKTTRFYNFTGFGGPDPTAMVGEYDYFPFVYERLSPDPAPHSWGGVSGGGLWQISLKREGQTIVDTSALLAGIAFYQDEGASQPYSIRCHGLHSVYNKAYEVIRGH